MQSQHRLRVGIDFGTTFSGVAWTHTAKPEEVVTIRDWPGGSGSHEKVPSEISYTPTGEVHKWGFEIKPGEERLAWIKLLLDSTQYASAGTRSSMLSRTTDLIPNGRGKRPVDVVADYLRCLKEHTIHILTRSYGKAFLDVTPIDYTLTVPAIWSDATKAKTLEAAEIAGFGGSSTIQLMSEPDAAAAWTLLKDVKPDNLKVDDAFVVVDCGGGTVDLISYQIEEITPKLVIKECAKGTGKLCGSSFLNQGFEDLVRSRIGKRFDNMKTVTRNRMLKEFEGDLKRSFSNSLDDDIFTCPIGGLPDDPIAGIEDGSFILTREDMQSIFDPVINQIIPLVREQIEMVKSQNRKKLRISSILLVGGFGASRYLLQRLENDLERNRGTTEPRYEVLQPVNAWSAVARGAALGVCISSRRARLHYGIRYITDFIDGVHPLSNLVYSRWTGEKKCKNIMRWYIKQGDEVSEKDPISFSYVHRIPVGDEVVFESKLCASSELEAPAYSDQTGSNFPKILCTLTTDMSTVPKRLLSKKIGIDGKHYYYITFMLVMTVKSANTLVFHSEFNGKKYGNVSVKYAHD